MVFFKTMMAIISNLHIRYLRCVFIVLKGCICVKFKKKHIWLWSILLVVFCSGAYYLVRNYYVMARIQGVVSKNSKLKDVKAQRISKAQARDLIGDTSEGSLVDITTKEVFSKLGYQIFKERGNKYRSYIIRDNKVYLLGEYRGASGVMDTCVSDLNKDGVPELIYSYSEGSGYLSSGIGMVVLNQEEHTYDARVSYGGEISLKKINDQCVIIQCRKGVTDSLNKDENDFYKSNWFCRDLGMLTIESVNKLSMFNEEVNSQLPYDVRYILSMDAKKGLPESIKHRVSVK